MHAYTVADAIRDASTQLDTDTIGDGHRTKLGYWHADSQFHWHYHVYTEPTHAHRHGDREPRTDIAAGNRERGTATDYLQIAVSWPWVILGIALGVGIGAVLMLVYGGLRRWQ
jgi:hypothetical protein